MGTAQRSQCIEKMKEKKGRVHIHMNGKFYIFLKLHEVGGVNRKPQVGVSNMSMSLRTASVEEQLR